MDHRSNVISNIRGVLISSRDAMPLCQLPNDYHVLVGEAIPFREFGYSDLESFLRSAPDDIKLISLKDGRVACQAVASERTKHINKLVQQQKTPKGHKKPQRPQYNLPSKGRPLRPLNRNGEDRKRNSKPNNSRPQPLVPVLDSPPLAPVTSWKRSQTNSCGQPSLQGAESNWNKQEWRASQSNEKKCSRVPLNISPLPPQVKINNVSGANSLPANAKHDRIVKQTDRSIHIECVNQSSQPGVYKRQLEEFMIRHNLGKLEYKSLPLHNTQSSFCGKVTFDGQIISTYPDEFSTIEEAENNAAKRALDSLLSTINSAEKTSRRTTASVSNVVQRLQQLLSDEPTGLINTHIPQMYCDAYNEKLPDDWMSIVDSNEALFKKSKVDDTRVIIFAVNKDSDQYGRKFSNSSSISNDIDSESKSYSSPPSDYLSDVSSEVDDVLKGKLFPPSFTLNLPESNRWDVYVTCAESTTDIKIRLIGVDYSTKYEDLAYNMREYYEGTFKPFFVSKSDIEVGDLMAVKEDDCWHRVEIEKINETTVYCLFVDCGDTGQYDISALRTLDLQFQNLPFQAVRCQLFTLEAVNDFDINENLIRMIVGKVLIADVVDRSNDINSIKLYDAKDSKYSINELLYSQRLAKVIVPEMVMGINHVYQSYIDGNGTIYFHSTCSDVHVLEHAIKAAVNTQNVSNFEILENSLYIAQTQEDIQRVKLTSEVFKGMVNAFFVDYGYSEQINVKNIYTVNDSYSYLMKVPYQAIACQLRNMPPEQRKWSKAGIQRLEELAPPEQILIARVQEKSAGIPLVELFKRIQPSSELVSVNQTLEFDCDIFHQEVPSEDKTEVSLPHNMDLPANTLPNFASPKLNELCDIHITLAATPFNFMFQMWMDGEKFDTLMINMNQYYNIENKGSCIETSEVVDGECYAVCYNDVWYRVQVHGTRSVDLKKSEMVMVNFIDYGDKHVFLTNQLKHLAPHFRNVPPQALHGKLAGIKPINKDWHTEDCVRFRQLVNERQFVALITQIELMEGEETSYVMQLIDTKGNNDVYIHKLLVEENRAYLAES